MPPRPAPGCRSANLIQALRNAFAAGATTPLRHRHALAEPGATLLLMPAWDGTNAPWGSRS